MLNSVSNFTEAYHNCGQRRSPPSILALEWPIPILGVCASRSSKFGLNRLRRSPSSSPNPFGGFQHHACMQACRFKPARSLAHSHCSIVQNRLVHNVPHSLFNVWAQRSHKLRNRFHTALVGTILVPISPIAKRLLGSTHNDLRYPLFDAA